MPSKAPTVCRRPGCAGLVTAGVCSVCGPVRSRAQAEHDERRGSAASRGYDARWRKLRLMVLVDRPWCAECERNGRITLATDVHHKIARRDGGADVADNLEPLCHSCHSQITAAGG